MRGQRADNLLGAGVLQECYVLFLGKCLGKMFTNNGSGSVFDGLPDEIVPIGLCATHGNKKTAGLNLAGVYLHSCYFHVRWPANILGLTEIYELFQFHFTYTLLYIRARRKLFQRQRNGFTFRYLRTRSDVL